MKKKIPLTTKILLGNVNNNCTYCTLLDTGTSASIISHQASKHLQANNLGHIKKNQNIQWKTQAGRFYSNATLEVEGLILP